MVLHWYRGDETIPNTEDPNNPGLKYGFWATRIDEFNVGCKFCGPKTSICMKSGKKHLEAHSKGSIHKKKSGLLSGGKINVHFTQPVDIKCALKESVSKQDEARIFKDKVTDAEIRMVLFS